MKKIIFNVIALDENGNEKYIPTHSSEAAAEIALKLMEHQSEVKIQRVEFPAK